MKKDLRIIIDNNTVAVSYDHGEFLVGDIDNRWKQVLSAITNLDKCKITIADNRTNRQEHQKDLTCTIDK